MSNIINENVLLDNFAISGTDYSEYKNKQKEYSALITAQQVELSDFICFDILEINADKKFVMTRVDPNCTIPLVQKDKGLPFGIVQRNTVQTQYFLNKGDFQSLIDETASTNKFMLGNAEYVGGEKKYNFYFFAKHAWNTMAQRIGLNALDIMEDGTERTLFVARKMKGKASFVTANYNGVSKILAVLSGRYASHFVHNDIIFDVADRFLADAVFGKTECKGWTINHHYSMVNIEFADKADEIAALYGIPEDIIPGIEIESSESGDCALRIRGYFKIKKNVIYLDKVARTHNTVIDVNDVIKEAKENIFDKFSELPEKLVDLMNTDITPAGLDLTNPKDQKKNKNAVMEAYKKCLKKIDMVKLFGKKAELAVLEAFSAELNPSLEYTGYDIVMDVFGLSDRIKAVKDSDGKKNPVCSLEKLKSEIHKAAYTDFSKSAKSDPAIVIEAIA